MSSSTTFSLDEKIDYFNTSIIIGVVLVTLIVITLMSITMNIWMRYKSTKIMARGSWKQSYRNDKTESLASIKLLTKPLPIFNKETTLPVYRKSDTWENYLKMMQTPDKLNEVVHSTKISHTPSSSISTKVGDTPGSVDGIDYYELQRQSYLQKNNY